MYSLTLVVELWIQLCSRLEMKDHLHQESYARSCREIEELKRCCYQEGNYRRNNEDWENFLRSMIRNHEQWVYSSTILTYWAVMTIYIPHQALITSFSRKPSREVGMPRNTLENISIPGNFFDRHHARRDPDEFFNCSRNLSTPLGIAEDVEDSEKRRNWE